MAKIIKIAPTTNTPSISHQIKTSRKGTTNPFKYQDFEGNSIPVEAFADVFVKPEQGIKFRVIAASIAGSMHKIKTGITEPIANFVNRVKCGMSSAWDYAKNTNVSDLKAIKSISTVLNTKIELPHINISNPIDGIKNSISEGIDTFSGNVVNFGKDMQSKWDGLISKITSHKKISADMSVCDLENLWKEEMTSCKFEEVA